jgi:hypothetical protein
MKILRSPLSLCVGGILFFSAITPALAAGARCELTAIEASNIEKGVDKELTSLKELTTPPLSVTYTRFKFIGRVDGDLDIDAEQELLPAKGYPAKLTFKGEKDGKLQIKINLTSLKVNTDVGIKPGGTFMFATKSGFLLAVSCDKKK